MKSFVYTCKEKCTQKTARVYRILKNRAHLVGEMTDSYVDEFQLVMKILKDHGALPPACFARHTNGCQIYSSAQKLEEDAFAFIERIE